MRLLGKHRHEGIENFFHGLMKFRFAGISADDGLVDGIRVFLGPLQILAGKNLG